MSKLRVPEDLMLRIKNIRDGQPAAFENEDVVLITALSLGLRELEASGQDICQDTRKN